VFVLYREIVDLREQVDAGPSNPQEIEDDEIVNLDLEMTRGSLKIVKGDKFSVRDTRNRPFLYSIQDDTFYLKSDRRMMMRRAGNIILTLPSDIELENIKIDIGGGVLEMSDLSSDKMQLSVGGGTITALDIKVQELQLKSGAGVIELSGDVTKSLDIDQGVGQTSILLDGAQSDFNYEVNYAVGHVKIGDREYSGIAGSDSINNNADKNMTIESGVGELIVQFRSR
ncbi:MAG: DUF4097 family beta strand repeat-containing protein, partial [Eubacteriales bacterium]|nr:DUF4097 family beta strand repeat-containing protein [Eubacteriales bacterium]